MRCSTTHLAFFLITMFGTYVGPVFQQEGWAVGTISLPQSARTELTGGGDPVCACCVA